MVYDFYRPYSYSSRPAFSSYSPTVRSLFWRGIFSTHQEEGKIMKVFYFGAVWKVSLNKNWLLWRVIASEIPDKLSDAREGCKQWRKNFLLRWNRKLPNKRRNFLFILASCPNGVMMSRTLSLENQKMMGNEIGQIIESVGHEQVIKRVSLRSRGLSGKKNKQKKN